MFQRYLTSERFLAKVSFRENSLLVCEGVGRFEVTRGFVVSSGAAFTIQFRIAACSS